MSSRIATGLAAQDAGVDSFAEAAAQAAMGLGGMPADLALVFAGVDNLDSVEEGLAAVQERLRPRALVGCGAQGVVGSGRELENGGVVVWAASLPEAELEAFHLEAIATSDAVAVAGMPDLDGATAAIMLVDPYSFPAEPLLDQLAEDHPGLPVVGGLASAGGGPGMGVLLCELAAQGLLIGIVIDENRPEYERGDFLVRGLLGADEETGAISVGERVRVGQTVRMHVRDGASADEDLRQALARVVGDLEGPPAGALLFTCNGRGSHMFAAPNHDAAALEDAFGSVPAAGFFCAGEIGPVGARNFVHGFTATLALFAS
jgi:small ligand-binding sensory domain FIST